MIPKPVKLDRSQVLEAAAFYAPLLKVQDWDIRYRLKPHRSMGTNDGTCQCWPHVRRADIDLVDYVGNEHPDGDAYDMEQTLVHEMVHVSHHGAEVGLSDADDRQTVALEQHIDAMAWAIVRLRRDGDHVFSWEQMPAGPRPSEALARACDVAQPRHSFEIPTDRNPVNREGVTVERKSTVIINGKEYAEVDNNPSPAVEEQVGPIVSEGSGDPNVIHRDFIGMRSQQQGDGE